MGSSAILSPVELRRLLRAIEALKELWRRDGVNFRSGVAEADIQGVHERLGGLPASLLIYLREVDGQTDDLQRINHTRLAFWSCRELRVSEWEPPAIDFADYMAGSNVYSIVVRSGAVRADEGQVASSLAEFIENYVASCGNPSG